MKKSENLWFVLIGRRFDSLARFMIKGLLMGLVIGIAGCNSHDSKQVTNSDKPAASHAAANTTRGNVGLAPVVNARGC